MIDDLSGALARATMRDAPFRWAEVRGLFAPHAIDALSRAFPDGGFERQARSHGTDKRYRLAARILRPRSGEAASDEPLAPAFRALVEALSSPAYRDALARLTGVSLDGHLLEIGCYRYASGGFVSPHRDKPQKSVGHVIYFNPVWDPAWGGGFRVLEGDGEDAIAAEISPEAGTSVVLVRSETSWHAVAPVTGPVDRLAVHVDFWRSDPGDAAGRYVEGAPHT